jgi:hypothetical protein
MQFEADSFDHWITVHSTNDACGVDALSINDLSVSLLSSRSSVRCVVPRIIRPNAK